jgi:hypothetical protein
MVLMTLTHWLVMIILLLQMETVTTITLMNELCVFGLMFATHARKSGQKNVNFVDYCTELLRLSKKCFKFERV